MWHSYLGHARVITKKNNNKKTIKLFIRQSFYISPVYLYYNALTIKPTETNNTGGHHLDRLPSDDYLLRN